MTYGLIEVTRHFRVSSIVRVWPRVPWTRPSHLTRLFSVTLHSSSCQNKISHVTYYTRPSLQDSSTFLKVETFITYCRVRKRMNTAGFGSVSPQSIRVSRFSWVYTSWTLNTQGKLQSLYRSEARKCGRKMEYKYRRDRSWAERRGKIWLFFFPWSGVSYILFQLITSHKPLF